MTAVMRGRIGSASAFIALAVLRRSRPAGRLRLIVRDWARPHDIWGAAQFRADLDRRGSASRQL